MCANWGKSSSDSSYSWFKFIRGMTGVSLVSTSTIGVPLAISSCQIRTRRKLSFNANPLHRRSSSLPKKVEISHIYLIANDWWIKLGNTLTQYCSQESWHAFGRNSIVQPGQWSPRPSHPMTKVNISTMDKYEFSTECSIFHMRLLV